MALSRHYHTFDETGSYLGYLPNNAHSEIPSAKISVIIPIYNTSEFLDQALQSVENQTYKNLEIICINDGSTDNSLDIIKEHAAKDDRIIIIDKQNEGYGASCNKGLEKAQGKWISIIEPDDWILPDMYMEMLLFAAQYPDAQIIKTPYYDIRIDEEEYKRAIESGASIEKALKQARKNENKITKANNCSYRMLVHPQEQPFTIEDEPELIKGHPSIWSAIYRKDFLENHGIRFREIPGAGWADNPFLIETMCQADKIVYLDEPFYCYRTDHEDKLRGFHLNNYDIPFKRWEEMLDIIEDLGITDERILMAHYNRGFVYLAGVLEYNGTDNPQIVELMKKMFLRMNADIVLSSKTISPGTKRLFAETLELPKPPSEYGYYAKKLVVTTARLFKSEGLGRTKYQILRYLKTHGKRTGHR